MNGRSRTLDDPELVGSLMSAVEQLRTAEGRREFFRNARQKLRRERTDDSELAGEGLPEPEFGFDDF